MILHGDTAGVLKKFGNRRITCSKPWDEMPSYEIPLIGNLFIQDRGRQNASSTCQVVKTNRCLARASHAMPDLRACLGSLMVQGQNSE